RRVHMAERASTPIRGVSRRWKRAREASLDQCRSIGGSPHGSETPAGTELAARPAAFRSRGRERAGKRVLNDEEIRDVWKATGAALNSNINDLPPCFGKLVRTLLLTAVRRTEAAQMSWPEIECLRRDDFDGDVWTCPGSRMKGKLDHVVPLTPAVRAIVGERPKDAKARPFVFSTTGGKRSFSGYSKAKRALDKEIAKLRKADGREPMPPWQLSRDLRRTAKTLMARAGVRPDISERVLAHMI